MKMNADTLRPRLTCSTCGQTFMVDQSPVPPFCSVRCQQIDLGRWFNEEIGLPVEPELDDEADDEFV